MEERASAVAKTPQTKASRNLDAELSAANSHKSAATGSEGGGDSTAPTEEEGSGVLQELGEKPILVKLSRQNRSEDS